MFHLFVFFLSICFTAGEERKPCKVFWGPLAERLRKLACQKKATLTIGKIWKSKLKDKILSLSSFLVKFEFESFSKYKDFCCFLRLWWLCFCFFGKKICQKLVGKMQFVFGEEAKNISEKFAEKETGKNFNFVFASVVQK